MGTTTKVTGRQQGRKVDIIIGAFVSCVSIGGGILLLITQTPVYGIRAVLPVSIISIGSGILVAYVFHLFTPKTWGR